MGCINVSAKALNKTVTCSPSIIYNQLDIEINKVGQNPQVHITPQNTLPILNVTCKNNPINVHIEQCNKKVQVTVALICQVAIDVYKLFYVEEGPFIVSNGYFMVGGK